MLIQKEFNNPKAWNIIILIGFCCLQICLFYFKSTLPYMFFFVYNHFYFLWPYIYCFLCFPFHNYSNHINYLQEGSKHFNRSQQYYYKRNVKFFLLFSFFCMKEFLDGIFFKFLLKIHINCFNRSHVFC